MAKLTEILQRKGRLLTTEFLPPKTAKLSDLVGKVLKVATLIDSVSLPELKANEISVPRFRMNPIFTALRLRDLTGVETIFHLTPRDYNKNAVAGLLLAAAETNLQNVLVVGGDRYSNKQEHVLSKNVYDYSGCTSLVKGIRGLESEAELGASRFCVVVGTDPTVIYTGDKGKAESEVAKLVERQDAGAELAQTQPVFDMKYFEFLDLAREQGAKIPILVGILPLRGKADSIEIEQRYGITIPHEVKSLLKENGGEAGKVLSLELAAGLMKGGVRCIHVYPREDCEFVTSLARTLSGSNQFP
jgi:5,10-methylenetetrahydrofolate reductase